MLLGSSTVQAQDKVRNSTNCDFRIRVAYGPIGGCTSTGIIDAIVPAGTSILLGIPPGNEIIEAKGAYAAIVPSCAFYIGLPCTGSPLIDSVPCTLLCGDYKARLYPGTGIWIYN